MSAQFFQLAWHSVAVPSGVEQEGASMAACAVAARTIHSVMSSLSLSLPLGTDAVLAIVDDALMKNVIVVDSRTDRHSR